MNIINIFKRWTYCKLLFFFSIIAGWPCVFYLMGWLPHYIVNYVLLLFLTGGYVLYKNEFRLPGPIAAILLLQMLVWLLYVIIHGMDFAYFTRIFYLLICYFILEIQLSSNSSLFKVYNYWIVFQVIAGTIGFLLVLTGFLEPLFEFKEMDMRTGYCFGFFTTNTYYLGLVRNAGYFDEPGALANWGMFALVINKLFYYNKKIEIILIFGLISTLSLAYFIQILFYAFFFYRSRIKTIMPSVLIFILLLKVVSMSNKWIDKAIFGRMEYNEVSGTISGDNRQDLVVNTWGYFQKAPWLGNGASHIIEQSVRDKKFVGANVFTTLATDGVVGQIVVLLPFFFLYYFGRYDKKYKYAFWILIIGLLQRPYDNTQLLYPLLTNSLVLYAYLDNTVFYGNENATNSLA